MDRRHKKDERGKNRIKTFSDSGGSLNGSLNAATDPESASSGGETLYDRIRSGEVTVKRGTRHDSRPWKGIFLEIYAQTGNVSIACQAAQIDRMTYLRHKEKDPEFARALEFARQDAIDTLFAAAFERAMTQSDLLMIFLLKHLDPDTFGDRKFYQAEVKQEVTVDHRLNLGEVKGMLKVLVQTGKISLKELAEMLGEPPSLQLGAGEEIDGEAEEIEDGDG